MEDLRSVYQSAVDVFDAAAACLHEAAKKDDWVRNIVALAESTGNGLLLSMTSPDFPLDGATGQEGTHWLVEAAISAADLIRSVLREAGDSPQEVRRCEEVLAKLARSRSTMRTSIHRFTTHQ